MLLRRVHVVVERRKVTCVKRNMCDENDIAMEIVDWDENFVDFLELEERSLEIGEMSKQCIDVSPQYDQDEDTVILPAKGLTRPRFE